MVEITVFDIKVKLYHATEVTVFMVDDMWSIPETFWYVERPEGFFGMAMTNFCKIAGFDWNLIDSAVPQDWFEDYKKKHGVYPRAWWSYNKNRIFGEPLMVDTVIAAYLKALQLEIQRLQGNGELIA